MLTPKPLERTASARSAAKLTALAVETARWGSVTKAGKILHERWADLSGTRSAYRALGAIVAAKSRTLAAATEDALRCAFMTPDEATDFADLTRGCAVSRVPLFRFTGATHRTGWYRSRDDAWAVWRHSRPPSAVERVCLLADEQHYLAVKNVIGCMEIVLTRSWGKIAEHCATKEALP